MILFVVWIYVEGGRGRIKFLYRGILEKANRICYTMLRQKDTGALRRAQNETPEVAPSGVSSLFAVEIPRLVVVIVSV